jgi:pimeloyl-ACP methyl ester carboxylesterase
MTWRLTHRMRKASESCTRPRTTKGRFPGTGDYSLGAHASLVRDILQELGHDRASFVGHSLGGGVAMQIAYQFPSAANG